jgi:hypothetical protein
MRMAKICIVGATVSRQGSSFPFRGRRHRRRKSRSARARDLVSRLSGAWLMDQQDSFSDCAR